jgi:hypothetical protein
VKETTINPRMGVLCGSSFLLKIPHMLALKKIKKLKINKNKNITCGSVVTAHYN